MSLRTLPLFLCALASGDGGGERAGGAMTVFESGPEAYAQPGPVLSEPARTTFLVGNSFFNKTWVAAPASVTERDGLGPLFNARSCSGCHPHDGRGRPPEAGAPAASLLVRLSVLERGRPVPEPRYGEQLQTRALPGLAPEAEVRVDYEPVSGRYADGEPYQLRRPRLRIEQLGYGRLASGVLTSARVAPAVFGLGLLEAVPEAALLAQADPEDRDGDGISGRANLVPDLATGRRVVGRFGWKAEQPSLRQQAAAAFHGDMGITSTLFPGENHTARQPACAGRPSGGTPELGDHLLDQVTGYLRALAVPARRHQPRARRGGRLFEVAGCARCHRPTLVTGADGALPSLAGQTIHPYTDLLLHDLGAELADGRPVFAATEREWRTPPLWGLGLLPVVNGHSYLLHDGRARGAAEAILWHGGEAASAREAFRNMPRCDRQALLAFLGAL
jgi:CxxC motif-containing protein (DUF1111 family)